MYKERVKNPGATFEDGYTSRSKRTTYYNGALVPYQHIQNWCEVGEQEILEQDVVHVETTTSQNQVQEKEEHVNEYGSNQTGYYYNGDVICATDVTQCNQNIVDYDCPLAVKHDDNDITEFVISNYSKPPVYIDVNNRFGALEGFENVDDNLFLIEENHIPSVIT